MQAYKEIYDEALQKMRLYIDAKNLHHSPEREVILRHICRAQRPLTTAEVVKMVEKEHVCRATVYNVLGLLTQAEVLRVQYLQTSSRAKQYRLFAEKHCGIQMVCTRCGRVVELCDDNLESLIMNKKYNNFNPRHYALFVYGECKTCRRKHKLN